MLIDKSVLVVKGTERIDRHYLSGTVTVEGVGASRPVAVFNRTDFTLLGVTISGANGDWKVWGVPEVGEGDVLVVTLAEDLSLNAVCADHVSQVATP